MTTRTKYFATDYIVCVAGLPEDAMDSWAVQVSWRGNDLWAVKLHGRQCLGADGEWDWESLPSGRTDEWLATHRFTLEEALRRAREVCPTITVNGLTALDVAEKAKRGEWHG